MSKGKSVINFRTVGGIIDVYAFAGDTAEEVIQQYHMVIGRPYLHPIWALGWQQGSASYKSVELAQKSYDNYIANGIPIEVMWIDESYMNKFRLFELNNDFSGIKTFSNTLHSKTRKLGISIHPGYNALSDDGKIDKHWNTAKNAGVFIKAAVNSTTFGDVLIGEGLPGKCSYLDFMHYGSYQIWAEDLKELVGLIGFDSLQLNMNEITQFCDGECPNSTFSEHLVAGKFDSLPFNPLGDNSPYKLDTKTISLESRNKFYHADEEESRVGYNTHSIYGNLQAQSTQIWFQFDERSPAKGKRSFVLSRATFAGTGQYSSHWLPNTGSTFEDMKHSISGILNFQIFGIPLTGADI